MSGALPRMSHTPPPVTLPPCDSVLQRLCQILALLGLCATSGFGAILAAALAQALLAALRSSVAPGFFNAGPLCFPNVRQKLWRTLLLSPSPLGSMFKAHFRGGALLCSHMPWSPSRLA